VRDKVFINPVKKIKRIRKKNVWCPSGAAPYLGVRHLNTHLWFSLLCLPASAIPGYPGEPAALQEW
jgi:hypothetical protein